MISRTFGLAGGGVALLPAISLADTFVDKQEYLRCGGAWLARAGIPQGELLRQRRDAQRRLHHQFAAGKTLAQVGQVQVLEHAGERRWRR